MTKKSKNRNFGILFNSFIELAKDCKFRLIIISTLCLILILTGLIVAIKTSSNYNVNDNFGVVDISSNEVSNSTFFLRLFSIILIFGILLGCSFSKYLSPIALIFLLYRSYLLGLNLTLMVIVYGISGVVVSIIIVLPCQLLILASLILFYSILSKTNCDIKGFGGCKYPKQRARVIVIAGIVLLALCLCESLLLVIFNAKIILVI